MRLEIYDRKGVLIMDLGTRPGYGSAGVLNVSTTHFEPEIQESISFSDDQGRVWIWTGLNAQGQMTRNGVYVARLSQAGGPTKEVAFSIDHVAAGLGSLDFVINPSRRPSVEFGLSLKPGVMAIAWLYNQAGERVSVQQVFPPRDFLRLVSSGGQPLASGVYVLVIDLNDGQGRKNRIVRKLAVLP